MNKESRERLAENTTAIGVVVNVVLTLFKFIAGFMGNSQAMIADATNSASDVFATVIVYISLKFAKQPVDEKHPYGHGRAESIAAAIVGFLLAGGGAAILFIAMRSIIVGEYSSPKIIALIAAAVSIVSKETLFRFTIKVGKKLESPAIIANARDHRADVYSSTASLTGVGGAILGFPVFDSIAGAGVSLFIIKTGYDVIHDAFGELMDAMPSKEVVEEIASIAEDIKGVEHVHEIKARKMGQYILVDLKVEIDPEITVADGHMIASEIRRTVMDKVSNVSDVMVHVNPHLS
ncbi:MAG: cation transporter [Actinobacteria bacterium]|nr:cation transporter [Actinomycetota bacterium]